MKKLFFILLVIVYFPCANSFAETRGTIWTPEQLLEKSTLVFEGVVLEIETTADQFKKTFPIKAVVKKILKGKYGFDEISLNHKNPGKSVIYEEEYNIPEVNQNGIFYVLVEWNDSFTLIGYQLVSEKDWGAHD